MASATPVKNLSCADCLMVPCPFVCPFAPSAQLIHVLRQSNLVASLPLLPVQKFENFSASSARSISGRRCAARLAPAITIQSMGTETSARQRVALVGAAAFSAAAATTTFLSGVGVGVGALLVHRPFFFSHMDLAAALLFCDNWETYCHSAESRFCIHQLPELCINSCINGFHCKTKSCSERPNFLASHASSFGNFCIGMRHNCMSMSKYRPCSASVRWEQSAK